jgi:hypothetical protein
MQEYLLFDILSLVLAYGLILAGLIISMINSDQTNKYKILTIISSIILLLLEIPHLFLPDPYSIIDGFTHFFVGFTIVLIISNLKFVKKEHRALLSFLVALIVIILVETFLGILEIVYGYINPISFNTYIDMLFVLFGGTIGFILFLTIHKEMFHDFFIHKK